MSDPPAIEDPRTPALAALRADVLAADEGERAFDLDASFAEVSKTRTADPVTSLRTEARVALAMALSSLVIGYAAATTHRHDLADVRHLALELGPLAIAWVVCLVYALRPWHRPEVSRVALFVLVNLGLGASVVVAVMPTGALAGLVPVHREVPTGAPCFTLGAAIGALTYLAARVVHRGPGRSTWLAAAAAGAAANLALTLHCPNPGVDHRLLSHAGVGFLLLGTLAVATLLVRPRTPR